MSARQRKGDTERTTLPRRANTIREAAAQLAQRKLEEEAGKLAVSLELRERRKAVSDRIGCALAVLMGAIAFRVAGWWALVLVAGYGVGAWRSYLAWRRMTQGTI